MPVNSSNHGRSLSEMVALKLRFESHRDASVQFAESRGQETKS